MSYWVTLYDANDPELAVCRSAQAREEGGTYVVGGTHDCTLNVTYNYSPHYSVAADFSLKDLDGLVASDTIPVLEKLVEVLGTVTSHDYWEATPGNAGHAINILLGWAREHPDGTWGVN